MTSIAQVLTPLAFWRRKANEQQKPNPKQYEFAGVFRNDKNSADRNLYFGFAYVSPTGISALGLSYSQDILLGKEIEKIGDAAIGNIKNIPAALLDTAKTESDLATSYFAAYPTEFDKLTGLSQLGDICAEIIVSARSAYPAYQELAAVGAELIRSWNPEYKGPHEEKRQYKPRMPIYRQNAAPQPVVAPNT